MSKKGFHVNVYSNKNKKQLNTLKIRCQGFQTFIPRLYIEQNNLIIKDGNTFISKELYEEWFAREIKEQEDEIRRERAIFDSFYPYIPLFWKKKELILKIPSCYSIRTPKFFMGLAYFGGCNSITLGELLMMWQNEKDLVFTCTCGGKTVCFQFGGSPLSCTEWISQTICLECEKIDKRGGLASPLRSKIDARKKYKPIEPVEMNATSYNELVNICLE
ncbi:MAG: hypothetical protein ACKO7D_07545 [Bacteroidota bacterium]